MSKHTEKKKTKESPRMTIRFPQAKLLEAIIALAKADGDRDPSAYARNVLRAHVEQKSKVA